MKIETRLAYMRIVEENFDPKFEVFIPEHGLTYTYEQDKPKRLEDAIGIWTPISNLGDDGWSLHSTIPKNLYIIGIFKREEHIESQVCTTVSNTYHEPAIYTILDMKKDPGISIIDLEFITVNKPLLVDQSDVSIHGSQVEAGDYKDISGQEKKEDLEYLSIITNTNPPFCALCGSSIKRKWWKPTYMCINPSCPNYWNKK